MVGNDSSDIFTISFAGCFTFTYISIGISVFGIKSQSLYPGQYTRRTFVSSKNR